VLADDIRPTVVGVLGCRCDVSPLSLLFDLTVAGVLEQHEPDVADLVVRERAPSAALDAR
jgi:hypothetical protein